MLANTTNVYITDKTGNKFFNSLCGSDYAMSEVRNLNRKIEEAKKNPSHYSFLDIDSAKVECDGKCGDYLPRALGEQCDDDLLDISDDELLELLNS